MPKIPKVPIGLDTELRSFLTALREAVVKQQQTTNPPPPPINLRTTPLPGGVKIEWTMSGAQGYTVMVSDEGGWDASTGRYIDAGESSEYTDLVGKGGVTRYYWVRSYTGNQVSDPEFAGKATTLALGTDATLPASVIPAAQDVVKSGKTGRGTVARIIAGKMQDGLG